MKRRPMPGWAEVRAAILQYTAGEYVYVNDATDAVIDLLKEHKKDKWER